MRRGGTAKNGAGRSEPSSRANKRPPTARLSSSSCAAAAVAALFAGPPPGAAGAGASPPFRMRNSRASRSSAPTPSRACRAPRRVGAPWRALTDGPASFLSSCPPRFSPLSSEPHSKVEVADTPPSSIRAGGGGGGECTVGIRVGATVGMGVRPGSAAPGTGAGAHRQAPLARVGRRLARRRAAAHTVSSRLVLLAPPARRLRVLRRARGPARPQHGRPAPPPPAGAGGTAGAGRRVEPAARRRGGPDRARRARSARPGRRAARGGRCV